MIERVVVRIWLFLLSGLFVVPLRAAEASSSADAAPASTTSEAAHTNVFHPITPGPIDGQIAFLTARMLERYHYLRQPFNGAVSSKFLDRYIELYDPMHLHFTQGDLADFEKYRTNLARLTLNEHGIADTRPGCEIFNRFVQRLQERVAYVDELLKTEKFSFDTDERILLNRKDQPYPKDLEEARNLWRDRLRFEYLQEKLGKADAKKKAAKAEPASGAEPVPGSEAKPPKTEAQEIVDTLSHRYHRNLRIFMDWDSDDVLQAYLNTLAHVYDPHSDYFGHAQLESFAITMNLNLQGIGAELASEDGYCTINRLLPGGPAIKSKKIHEKDRIIAVAQSNQPPVDVVDMSLNKAVQLIRGPKGTEVTLTVIPAGADAASQKVITLVRDEIPLEDQAAKARIIDLPNDRGENVRLGVIDLPSFYAPFDPSNSRGKTQAHSTTEDVSLLLSKLKQEKVEGVVLDLRHNGGGSLEEAIKLTGLFIKEGPVVQVKDFDGSVQVDNDDDPKIAYDGPLIVLTSRQSASASEILAGALQDYGRALIVGDISTHGKGTVQSVQELKNFIRMGNRPLANDPGALKLTIKKFYRASGVSTQLKGVVPDVVLPSVLNESKEIGENSLENPLPCDKIESARYEHLNLVDPYVQALRKRSEERVGFDKDFSYVREDIDYYKKQQADKTVSLNEQQRLKEKEELDARLKARDKERLARPEPNEKIYELSLKQAALPGLPPPLARTNLLTSKLSSSKPAVTPAIGTNATLAATQQTARAITPDPDAEEEKPPAIDATLSETEHILMDYISLWPKANVVTAIH
jgi:carboxyl-terminal processing protease